MQAMPSLSLWSLVAGISNEPFPQEHVEKRKLCPCSPMMSLRDGDPIGQPGDVVTYISPDDTYVGVSENRVP